MAQFGPEEFVLKDGRVVIFKHCTPSDAVQFPSFQQQIASETTNTMQMVGETPALEKIIESWQQSQEDPNHLRIGGFHNNRLIGQLGFRPLSPIHPYTKHIGQFGMMILQEFWGQGIGRRMLEIMEEHARRHEFTRIEALVRQKNERGVKLYQNAGYNIEGTRKQAALINKEYSDEFFIAKILISQSERNDFHFPTLATERLILRPIIESDAENIFSYAKNPNVSKYTLWEPHEGIQDSLNFIREYVFPNYQKQVPEPFGTALKNSPEKLIGTVGCFWVSESAKHMELAYALPTPYIVWTEISEIF